jgi:transposase
VPSGRRYPTDLTDQQWALIEPLLPDPPPGPAGRPPAHDITASAK